MFAADQFETRDVSDPHDPHYPIHAAAAEVRAARAAGTVDVSTQTVGGIPAAMRAILLLSTTAGSLEPVAYRYQQPIPDQPRVIRRPDPFLTQRDFIAGTVSSMATSGAAVWLTSSPDSTGFPSALTLVDPREVTVEWLDPNVQIRRRFRWRGADVTDRVIYVPLLLGPGALQAQSPIQAAATSLGSNLAAEALALSMWLEGAVPTGVLEAPTPLTKPEADALKAQWIEGHGDNMTPAVLSGGMAWKQTQFNPDQLQFLGSRDWSVGEIARIWGIPPHLLAWSPSGSTLTYATVAQLSADFLRFTLAPYYLHPIEAALSDLLPSTQTVRFDTSELLRGDVAARYDAYATGIAAGFLSPDEVRLWEGIADTPVNPNLQADPARMT